MDISGKIHSCIERQFKPLLTKQNEEINRTITEKLQATAKKISEIIEEKQRTTNQKIEFLQAEILSLKTQNEQYANNLKELSEMSRDILDRLKMFLCDQPTEDPEAQDVQEKTYFTKMVDSTNPSGFLVKNLKGTAHGCVFEIRMHNATDGEYEIIHDKEIISEVFSIFDPVITSSSEFDSIPQNATDIIVLERGAVKREQDVLKITKKQKIKLQ